MRNPIYRFRVLNSNTTIFTVANAKIGYTITTQGEEFANSRFNLTDYISISGTGTRITLPTPSGTGNIVRIGYYDAQKRAISTLTNGVVAGDQFLEYPAGCQYIRISTTVDIWAADYPVFEYRYAKPNYGKTLSVESSPESNQQFFRNNLSGKLTFLRKDYLWMAKQRFETIFLLDLFQSNDNGKTWNTIYTGRFTKTDGAWDNDHKRVEIQPETEDAYNAVLAGMEKEFDLIKLAPEIRTIEYLKRPFTQIYVRGDSSLTNIMGHATWVQQVNTPVFTMDELDSIYKFFRLAYIVECRVSNKDTGLYEIYAGKCTVQWNEAGGYNTIKGTLSSVDHPNYQLLISFRLHKNASSGNIYSVRIDDTLTSKSIARGGSNDKNVFDLDYYEGSGKTGVYGQADIYSYDIFERVVMDTNIPAETAHEKKIFTRPVDDIVEISPNYRYVGQIARGGAVESMRFSKTPTEWGLAEEGTGENRYRYFLPPQTLPGEDVANIGKSSWRAISVWYQIPVDGRTFEDYYNVADILRNAYPVSSCIASLLREIAPDVTHEATVEYSNFLYGPLVNNRLFITPKTNILKSGYDRAAQKAPITLKSLADMLRDCCRAYWYIEDNKFKIEHISWFRNGGSLTPPDPKNPKNLNADLPNLICPPVGKSWAFLTNKWTYEKLDMPERIVFEWMDEVSDIFEGQPIEILSNYVSIGRKEEITVSNFTSDVDFMLANPSVISSDGFALLYAEPNTGIVPIFGGASYILQRDTNDLAGYAQNKSLSFEFIAANYYTSDLPAWNVSINGMEQLAIGVTRKRMQEVSFPTAEQLDPQKLVRTYVGNGQIAKATINITTRMAKVTLAYDTCNKPK